MGDGSRSILPEKEIAILAGGCFWCLEAVYDQVDGVESECGYIGRELENLTYEAVCGGQTGHAVIFDPKVISYREILEIFSPSMILRPSIGKETIGNLIPFIDFLLHSNTTQCGRNSDQNSD
jgi:peptide methionine sulfoxide reductase